MFIEAYDMRTKHSDDHFPALGLVRETAKADLGMAVFPRTKQLWLWSNKLIKSVVHVMHPRLRTYLCHHLAWFGLDLDNDDYLDHCFFTAEILLLSASSSLNWVHQSQVFGSDFN